MNVTADGKQMKECITILVSENDPNDRALFHRALERSGLQIKIIEIADGAEVLRYLNGEGMFADRAKFPFPNALVLDQKMPRMNGLEVLGWLRAHQQFRALPVIVLSGSAEPAEVASAYTLGASAFIQKPDTIDGYHHLVRILANFWRTVRWPMSHQLSLEERRTDGSRFYSSDGGYTNCQM